MTNGVSLACGARRGSFSLSLLVLSVVVFLVFTVFSEARWIVTCNKSEPLSRVLQLLTSRVSLARASSCCMVLLGTGAGQPMQKREKSFGKSLRFVSRFARYRRECGMRVAVAE